MNCIRFNSKEIPFEGDNSPSSLHRRSQTKSDTLSGAIPAEWMAERGRQRRSSHEHAAEVASSVRRIDKI